MTTEPPTIASTVLFVKAWHTGQVDKAGQPYYLHPFAVADMLAEHGRNAILAGLLHDIVEVTHVTLDMLHAMGYPTEVIDAVDAVTRRKNPDTGEWAETYFEFIHRAALHPLGRKVKLADNAHNSDPDRPATLDQDTGAADRAKRYRKARIILEAAENTAPEVFTTGVTEGWADPETDPTRIDWQPRLATAAIPFATLDGRPVNPVETTGIRYGRNQHGHWGEKLAGDAFVTAITEDTGTRWLLLIKRGDGYGWALPGGGADPGETGEQAAIRELREETGLDLPDATWTSTPPQYVHDPRNSDESWMVTVVASTELRVPDAGSLPAVNGHDDAADAAWIPADTPAALANQLHDQNGGHLFSAHRNMIASRLADSVPAA